MRYQGTVYRPPSERNSLVIQGTIGCPHNKCSFCTMYKDVQFRIRPVEEIKKDLDIAKEYYGAFIETVFIADGNSILMKTEELLGMFRYTQELFPNLQRITLYGSAKYILLKSPEELRQLRAAGLKRLHSGMESGDDQVLKLLNKGATGEEVIEAAKRLKEADIETSQYIMIGAGGKKWSKNHARNSAKVLNQCNPDFIRLRTFMVFPRTPIYEMYKNKSFQLLTPYEALEETKLLIQELQGIDSMLFSDHPSNYWNVEGRLPEDKKTMLEEIDYALTLDKSVFRDPRRARL
ncbi:radical SAM protein [Isachenkonia alkalipeptolytica]|uniref:Radical SAM protein n=1 Tax=Isachenkonia alkalipeptolytica TaxID=2565777 RepID=A0AA43XK41_9CLOT|nr:radical SAM protein [Isachenkonia alkalipeptolytica]NBG87741.1 radical SAM protein [Isachenkonia alkalipeptolytica]